MAILDLVHRRGNWNGAQSLRLARTAVETRRCFRTAKNDTKLTPKVQQAPPWRWS